MKLQRQRSCDYYKPLLYCVVYVQVVWMDVIIDDLEVH